MIDLDNKIILITGSSSGIGKACSIAFGKLGAKIALTGRSEKRMAKVKEELDILGVHSGIFKFDLLQDQDIPSLIKEVEKYFDNTIDILINSAGIGVLGLVENVPLEAYKDNFKLNFFAPVELIRSVLPGMKKKHFGQIINLFSGVGKRGLPGVSAYCSSKFALNGFSESLRVELMKDNIDVIVFSPGLVETNFASNIVLHGELKNKFTEGKSLKPSVVASKIAMASLKRKREVTLSVKTKLGILLNFFSPKLLDKYLYKQL